VNRRELLQRGAVLALPAWTRTVGAADPAVTALAHALDGDVVRPGTTRYTGARQLWDSRFDALHPRAIAYCANAADVQRTIRWGRTYGIRVVPRSGGHSYAGYSSGNGVVVADVSRLDHIASSGGTARVGAGTKLIDVYSALWHVGRTIPGGSCPSVGVAGLALGGGIGYSSRLLGTTADALRRVQIATADGNDAVISGGLLPGMLVVSAGVHVLSPGQKVTIYQDKLSASTAAQEATLIVAAAK